MGQCARFLGVEATGVLVMVTGLLLVQSGMVQAQAPVPAFEQIGKPAASGSRTGPSRVDQPRVRKPGKAGENTRPSQPRHTRIKGNSVKTRPAAPGLPGPGQRGIRSTMPPTFPRTRPTVPKTPRTLGTRAATQKNAKDDIPDAIRVRVAWKGFKVVQPTLDDPLQFDGKGDEVYYAAMVFEIRGGQPIRAPRLIRSKVMGDVNKYPRRVRAGNASDKGGLIAGDLFPMSAKSYVNTFYAGKPPMLLYEGTLRKDLDAVVIFVSLWEWDGDDRSFRRWRDWVSEFTPELESWRDFIVKKVGSRDESLSGYKGDCAFYYNPGKYPPVYGGLSFDKGDELLGRWPYGSQDGPRDHVFIINANYWNHLGQCSTHHTSFLVQYKEDSKTGGLESIYIYHLYHQLEVRR